MLKKRDACYAVRVVTPSGMLTSAGHEIKEEMMELSDACKVCGKGGWQEFQFFREGETFSCTECKSVFKHMNVKAWRESVRNLFEWADVIVFQRPTDEDHLKLIRMAKEQKKFTVFEGDDNYIEVPQWNSGFAYYSARRGIIEAMLREAHAVSVTTEALRLRYSHYNKNVTILPNSLDLELISAQPPLEKFAVMKFQKGQIKTIECEQYLSEKSGKKLVLWGGSPTHEKDLELLLGALKTFARKEPDFMFGFAGYVHRSIFQIVPPERLFMFGLVPVVAYISLYKAIGAQVGLAPVVNIPFNHAKSPLKVLEYQSLGIMPVASHSTTYSKAIGSGFLAHNGDDSDWFFKIRKAASCEDREDRLKQNGEFVHKNFDIKSNYKLWENFYASGAEKCASLS